MTPETRHIYATRPNAPGTYLVAGWTLDGMDRLAPVLIMLDQDPTDTLATGPLIGRRHGLIYSLTDPRTDPRTWTQPEKAGADDAETTVIPAVRPGGDAPWA